MVELDALIQALGRGGVDFIIVGGVAATIHGSARLTQGLDVVYSRTPENISRLVGALAPYAPYLRRAPPGLPFRGDAETIRRGLNFTPTTTLGDVDVLGEIVGGGGDDELLPPSPLTMAFEIECRCLGLDRLIHVKRAAGRPKDLDAIAEREALLEEGGDSEPS